VESLPDILFRKTLAALASRRRFPTSTYRVQFHAGFTFRDAAALVPYLHELGVTDLYASPYLKSRPGSQHGYDISDHRALNPEIGTREDYDELVRALHERGMGQLLDTVPNHMGVGGNNNAWWNDVLENGQASPYAGYFDIDWHPAKTDLDEKVLLPFLGDPYGKVLEAGQLRLGYETGSFAIHYYEHRFPVSPCSYARILERGVPDLEARLGAGSEALIEYHSVLTAIRHLPPRNDLAPERMAERQREKEVIKRRLAALADVTPAVRAEIDRLVEQFNGRTGAPHSFDLLDDLLNHQAYRLAWWRVASDEINYRRFFDVNELAAISMERPEVFEATHELILSLLAEDKITGLRIDHPDGLYDPRQYLERLQERFFLATARKVFDAEPEFRGRPWEEVEPALRDRRRQEPPDVEGGLVHRPLYVVVEKILGKDEPVPENWPVHGTTGYEFLNLLNGLFVDPGHAAALSRVYTRWSRLESNFPDIVYQKKLLILRVSLSSELQMLALQLDRLSEKHRWSRDFTLNSIRHALREIIACFPVYRSYITEPPIHPRDRYYVETAVNQAKMKNPAISSAIFDFARDMILLRDPETATEQDKEEQRRFVGKFQQVTAPVMAKGLEDTAFYVYNRLLSLNEVGGAPDRFGVSPEAFHHHNGQRQKHWPYSLSTTSTHDTKRSADARARLNVLSELTLEWQVCLSRWNRLNKRLRVPWQDGWAPDRNDEYLLYQTLIGAWPVTPLHAEEHAVFVGRIQAYMEKALREAKVHTSWINPNTAYDQAVRQFVARLLDEGTNGRFLTDFRAFQGRVSHFGLFNALAQTLLKIASPGVPDVYQGTELWDFSLVDPDNRRPVDYERRRKLLGELKATAAAAPSLPEFARRLTETKEDGRIKLYVTRQALLCRREQPGLFTVGNCLPAEAAGSRAENVVAFVRRHEGKAALVVVPRLLTQLIAWPGELPLGPDVWGDTVLLVPGARPGESWQNTFTGEALRAGERDGLAALALGEVFRHFPVALFLRY
jgi:(1->4)-alpha-D-glucan 1-alpha-D-glucosylmutase